jgi:hypothetical protein
LKRLTLLGFCLALIAPGIARADQDFYPLYSIDPSTVDAHASTIAQRLVTTCNTSAFSRLGPPASQIRRCDAIEAQLISCGQAGVRAALAKLDDPRARNLWPRLYDVVARSGDLANVEPLVHALELEDWASSMNRVRHNEQGYITQTLSAITYAAPVGAPAVVWRSWANTHRDLTRVQLYAERRLEVDAQLARGSVEEQAIAVSFLAQRSDTRALAREKLDALRRMDLGEVERAAVKHAEYSFPVESERIPQASKPSSQRTPLLN